jgi:hypothetical protein
MILSSFLFICQKKGTEVMCFCSITPPLKKDKIKRRKNKGNASRLVAIWVNNLLEDLHPR